MILEIRDQDVFSLTRVIKKYLNFLQDNNSQAPAQVFMGIDTLTEYAIATGQTKETPTLFGHYVHLLLKDIPKKDKFK